MKKVFLLLFIVFFVCGCSNLKCERVIDNEDKTIKVTFKDEKVNKLSIHEIKSFARTDAYLDLYYYEQNTYLSSLNIPDGFNFSVVDHKEDVTTKISIDFRSLFSSSSFDLCKFSDALHKLSTYLRLSKTSASFSSDFTVLSMS